MRFFVTCALLLPAVKAEAEQFVPEGGKSLEEVYGPVANVDEVVPWYERGIHRNALPSGFFDVRHKDNCTFPIEVYIIQDETASFADNYIQMRDQELPYMVGNITAHHPNSTFGVGTHRDKPIKTLGWPATDYCWKFRLPLTSEWEPLHDTFNQLVSTGGGDAPEYQFGSIIAAAQEQTPGWSNPLAARLLVVSTDAQPHFEGDGFNKYNLKPYVGTFDRDHPDQQCITQYYPTPTHVKTALLRREAYAAFLIFDGNHTQGGKPIDAWNWFNSYIEQSPEFVSNVQEGAKGFWEKLSYIIKKIEDIECDYDHDDSTTHAVTTPAPTTHAVTTPPTTHAVTTPVPTTHVVTAPPTTHAVTTPALTTHAVTTPPTTHAVTTPVPTTHVVTTSPTTHAVTTPAPTTHAVTTPPTTHAVTTPAPTTHAVTTPPTTHAVTSPEHTTEDAKEPECPNCPEGDCPCPAVKIVLQEKPLHLVLEVDNIITI